MLNIFINNIIKLYFETLIIIYLFVRYILKMEYFIFDLVLFF